VARLPGSGVLYWLTVPETTVPRLAGWPPGCRTMAPTPAPTWQGRHRRPAGHRAGLAVNSRRAVVAISALGIGYDKPDLAFIAHCQPPTALSP
jgi:hypothetical protein